MGYFLGLTVILLAFFTPKIIEETKMNLNWETFDDLFKKYGQTWGVNWTWLKAIALNESSLGAAPSVARGLSTPQDIEGSKSSDGKSWGLMQLTLTTARALDPLATPEKLNDPEYSVNLAAKLLKSDIMPQFSTSDSRYLEYVIKSYNQGWPNTKKYDVKGVKGAWSDHVEEYWQRFQRNLKKIVLGG